MEIYLIGTNHWDVNSESRLERKLSEIAPEFILVEGSYEVDAWINRSYALFSKELAKVMKFEESRHLILKSRVAIGNEFRAVRGHCIRYGKKFEYFNDLDLKNTIGNEKKVAKLEAQVFKGLKYQDILFEMKSEEASNNKVWKQIKEVEDTSKEYNLTDYFISEAKDDNIGARDYIMELKVRNSFCENISLRLVCVTGYVHVLDDLQNRTLYTKIKELSPKRVFLYE
ncbi:MAG: hypothetical protein Q7S27_01025 [Nanoarchaeota archaeon]|nr:hypothetical protein [Nanoarchaeota archaeon]